MKYFIIPLLLISLNSFAQDDAAKYPLPEFSKEIYYLAKPDMKLMRLEKEASSMNTKTRAGGFGGAEMGYFIEGNKSRVRLNTGEALSFIYYTGPPRSMDPAADSTMRANGIDPSMSSFSGMDPSSLIQFYVAVPDKDKRKVLMAQGGGIGFGKSKNTAKYTYSLRQVKEGYYELLIDKTLPKGEYAFVVSGMTGDGSSLLFAFGID